MKIREHIQKRGEKKLFTFCHKCSKKYVIANEVIKHHKVSFKCKSCGSRNTVERLDEPSSAYSERGPATEVAPADLLSYAGESARKGIRLGIVQKFFLYLMLPFVFVYGGITFISMNQISKLTDIATQESSRAVLETASNSLRDQARSVAKQARQFLYSNPDLQREEFNRNIYFKKLAAQRFGRKGHTSLYEIAETGGTWRTWVHINPELVGRDMAGLKDTMGAHFNGFWDIYTGVTNGRESQGRYTWRGRDGKLIDKIMYATPIKGTPYAVMATANIDEFLEPVDKIRAQIAESTEIIGKSTMIIMVGGLLVNILLLFFYGKNLTGRIRYLAGVADQISVGTMDVDIKNSSQDELGELAESIRRMQDSIKLFIQRVKKRGA